MTQPTVGGSATAAKACRDAGIYDEAIREIESRIEMLEHRIGRVKDAYSRIHGNQDSEISAGLVWAADDAAGLAEYVDGVRRRVATSLAASFDELCLADVAGYGQCIQQAGHDGAHRDANGYEFTTAVQS